MGSGPFIGAFIDDDMIEYIIHFLGLIFHIVDG
jgi:uncharacterized membrane protein required for colicin V production